MMGRVMPEKCWVYKKDNKIRSDIYLVFYSSVFTMMHGPANVRFVNYSLYVILYGMKMAIYGPKHLAVIFNNKEDIWRHFAGY